LLTAGDPARLPTIVREAVLTDVIEQIAAKRLRLPILDHDSVKRFVQGDLAQTIQRLWSKHNGHFKARERLLWLIWLGQLKDCADLAEAALYSHQDRRTRMVAGRAIAAAGCRLMEQYSLDEAPVDAIDAALRLGVARRYGRHSLREPRDVAGELRRTAARRRLAFWRAAEVRIGHRWLQGQPLEHPVQIEMLFGFSLGLQIEDVAWLLADARARAVESERRLAINTVMRLWRDANSPAELLSEIETVARTDPATQSAYEFWQNPPPPSPEQIAHDREMNELREQAEAEHAARDRSWLEFIDGLRKDPDQLRHVRPPSAESIDGRLYHLWQLLSETVDGSTRYALDSIVPLEPMLGPQVAAAARDGLIHHWRLWSPKLKSARSADERNQINIADCMGITGISLEARTKRHWCDELSSDEALLAGSYATLEINGFPSWLSELAAAKPAEVRKVLMAEVEAELADPEAVSRFGVLEDLSRADKPVVELMAPLLFEELKRRDDLSPNALAPMLSVIAGGLREHRQRFAECALDRFNNADDTRVGSLYLAAAFTINSTAATEALMARLDRLDAGAQTALAQLVLPSIFGMRFRSDEDMVRPSLSFGSLQRLVVMAYRTIRMEDDRNRPSGQAYSPDERDNAEHARGTAFNQFVETPGRATFEALLRLAEDPDFPLDKTHLRELANKRAAQDSESAPWLPAEVIAFEQTAEAAPSTGKDLQRTALRRFDDIQHDLLHGDFAQGATVQALANEQAVQNWTAERLRLKQGRAYSVEREPHVADEKEPDVRLRAKASDASVAIEIKVPESWTVTELEAALSDQLCGRYLRARDARHGILLLVHKKKKPKGWKDPQTGSFLSFDELVGRLCRLARDIASGAPEAPQPEIAVLDVSDCTKPITARTLRRSTGTRDKRLHN
jgi:hypothetical protein